MDQFLHIRALLGIQIGLAIARPVPISRSVVEFRCDSRYNSSLQGRPYKIAYGDE